MTKQRFPDVNQPLNGCVLGYALGAEKVHLATLHMEQGQVRQVECPKFANLHETLRHFAERPKPLGIGLEAVMALTTGSAGWRAADYWIDKAPFHYGSQYDGFPFSDGPFRLTPYGEAQTLAAIALLSMLRRRWPHLPASETSPSEYYTHLVHSPACVELPEKIATLSGWLKVELPIKAESKGSEPEAAWQANMSAYAMWKGLRGDWPIDLFQLKSPAHGAGCISWGPEDDKDGVEEMWQEPASSFENLVFPAGPVSFFWPPDERWGYWPEPGQ